MPQNDPTRRIPEKDHPTYDEGARNPRAIADNARKPGKRIPRTSGPARIPSSRGAIAPED